MLFLRKVQRKLLRKVTFDFIPEGNELVSFAEGSVLVRRVQFNGPLVKKHRV